jgi:serine/threonine-protein kinase Chk2
VILISPDVAPEILLPSGSRQYTKAVDVWSLGVVLYICLCGFPPFSDELRTSDYPFSLAQQIKMGRFDYPSPYWDSVGDPALDLIDRMLTVDAEKRITVDECLEHPWMTGKLPSVTDSTDGLTGALGKLDFSKRKMQRERTLLSSINDAHFSQRAEGSEAPVKVFRNEAGKRVHNAAKTREVSPSGNRDPKDFINIGEHGDPALYDD